MRLHQQQEAICRELGNVEGLVISLANQAILLEQSPGKSREALPLAEEAHRLIAGRGMASREKWVKSVLEDVRATLK
jgi:hypothetical protein